METYRYKGIDGAHRRIRGSLEAADAADLERRLERMGVTLLAYRRARWRSWRRPGARRDRTQLLAFNAHLEQLLRAGVPVAEALEDLQLALSDPAWRALAAELAASIQGGRTLSAALAAFPDRFDAVYVAMVRVGEETGRLPAVLSELDASLRWQDETAAQTRRVMVYPVIVLAVVGAVTTFLMLYLVPKLSRFIDAMGASLPWYTQALIATANGLAAWGWLVAASAAVVVLTARWLIRRSTRWRFYWDALKLRLWLVGDLSLRMQLARFAHALALMYGAGITVLEALRLGEALFDNAVLGSGVARARAAVEQGQTLSEAFAATALFPPFVVRMMRVGEATGALDEALRHVSYFYARGVRETVERLQPAIQPVLTVVLAGLIGWIAVAVFWPIYETMTAVGR